MDRTDVGPRELSDGMGVDLNLGGFVTGWGSDGRNTGWTCGYMQMHAMYGMHADAWDAWDAWDGWPWQAGTREWRETRARWQARVGECRRVQASAG